LIENNVYAASYLDIGSGGGELTQQLAKAIRARQYFCLDIDASALRKATSRGCISYRLNLEYDKFPFESDFFDLITAFDIIEHLRNPDNMLRESYRVLKRGGFLLLTTPNIASWYNRLLLLFGEPPLGIDLSTEWRYHYPFGVKGVISGHVRMYTIKSIVGLLEYHRFKVMICKGFAQIWSKTKPKGFLKIVFTLDKMLSKYSKLAPNILILARK